MLLPIYNSTRIWPLSRPQINQAHALANKLLFFSIPQVALYDISGSGGGVGIITPGSMLSVSVTNSGIMLPGYSYSAVNGTQAIKYLTPQLNGVFLTGGGSWTVLTVVNVNSYDNSGTFPRFCSFTQSASFLFEMGAEGASSTTIGQFFVSDPVGPVSSSNTFVTGTHVVVGTRSPAALSLYVDGIMQSGGSLAPAAAVGDTTHLFISNRSASDRGWPGTIPLVAIWGRTLSPLEIKQASSDPLCFVTFAEDEIFAEWVGKTGVVTTRPFPPFQRWAA